MTQSNIFNTIIYIDVCDECNWDCEYCNVPYKNSIGDINRPLKISKLFELRKINYNPSNTKFIITGGEPSIYGLEYNQSIIKAIKLLHNSNMSIEYASNLSAPADFYINLDATSFLFSYHPSRISFNDFITKFETIITHKDSLIRVPVLMKDLFSDQILNYNPTLINKIVWYNINDIDSDNSFSEYDNVPEIYELHQAQNITRKQ